MDAVCEVCGDVGYIHLLVQCNGCQNATRHRYCLDPIIYDGSSVEWFCDDCPPKHNEAVESLKERRDNYHFIQLGSSMIDEPNVNRVDMTTELWPWGRRRRRSHKARRYSTWGRCKPRSHKARRNSTDAWTKCQDTFNLSEIFVEEKSKHNAVLKEIESENEHLIYQPENAYGSSHSASDLATEIQKKPTVNTIECLDLSTEKDSCSFSQNVEGSIPHGTKADFLPLINDVERSHSFVTNDSCPILPIAEQKDVSSHALGSAEQPHPFEVVNPDGLSHSLLDPALKIEEQEIEAGLFVLVDDVEQHCPLFTDEASHTLSSEEQVNGSSPMSESWEQPHPLEVIKPCDYSPKSILGSVPQSTYSQQMQGSDPPVGNMDVLDPSKECLDSRSMSKNVELSSSSDGDGNSAIEKDNTETTKYLSATETVTLALENVKGSRPSAEPSSFSNGEGDSAVKEDSERTECLSGTEPAAPAVEIVQGSSPSTTKGCLVSNVDNSDEVNRSDKPLLCTKENKELGQLNVLSCPNISSGEVHCSHNDLNESSNPKPKLKGRNLQKDVRKISVSGGKNGFCRHLQNDANSEALPSKHVSLCKATKSSFKKQHDELNNIPHHTKHQKTKSIMKERNAYPAHPRICRPSKQLDRTCLSASSELSSKAKEVNNANDAEPRCSRSVPTYENVVPKKRKELTPYDEDAKAMWLKESNSPSSKNDGQVKVHRRRVEGVVMNKRSAENYEVMCPGNSTNQHVNDHTQAKKKRRVNKDKKEPLVNYSVPCAHNDAAEIASEAVVAEGRCSLSRMPAVSGPTDQQGFICTQPIDRPYWTGIMKIGQEYISLAAHLSNQSCKKVQELSRSLPPVMKVTEHSKFKAWPKRWKASEPCAESIGLYFFPDNMRPNKDLDRLLRHVTDHNIVLKYVFGSAKLLIFPSVFLAEQCQMFQGKHYLWGVFKSRMGTSKAGSPVKQKVCVT